MARRAKVFVVTGPSGVGKGTLIERLLQSVPGLELSVSATTRNGPAYPAVSSPVESTMPPLSLPTKKRIIAFGTG